MQLDGHFVFKLKKNLSITFYFCYFAPQKGTSAFVKVNKDIKTTISNGI